MEKKIKKQDLAPLPSGAAQETSKEAVVDSIIAKMDMSERMMHVPDVYKHTWVMAQQIANGDTIPKHYKKKPENVFMALVRSAKLKVDVYWLMEKSYVVHGRLGFEGKLKAAIINKSGLLKGRLMYKLEGEGENRRCTCSATLKETNEKISMDCSYALAKANGWTKPDPVYKGWGENRKPTGETTPSKWDTIRDLMLMYRSASFLGDTYFPELLGGLTEIEPSEAHIEDQDEFPDREQIIGEAVLTEKGAEILADKFLGKTEEEDPPPTGPQSEEKAPAEDLVKKDEGPTGLSLIDIKITEAEISRKEFNGYLVSRNLLKPGQDMVDMKALAISNVSKKIDDAIVDYGVWKRLQDHEAAGKE